MRTNHTKTRLLIETDLLPLTITKYQRGCFLCLYCGIIMVFDSAHYQTDVRIFVAVLTECSIHPVKCLWRSLLLATSVSLYNGQVNVVDTVPVLHHCYFLQRLGLVLWSICIGSNLIHGEISYFRDGFWQYAKLHRKFMEGVCKIHGNFTGCRQLFLSMWVSEILSCFDTTQVLIWVTQKN